jgi:hypothetical protein
MRQHLGHALAQVLRGRNAVESGQRVIDVEVAQIRPENADARAGAVEDGSSDAVVVEYGRQQRCRADAAGKQAVDQLPRSGAAEDRTVGRLGGLHGWHSWLLEAQRGVN